jgi:hypothetical protein
LDHDLAITINVAIVCTTLLTALFMFRRSVERVARQRHTVFMLLLPFGITWMFAGGEHSSEIEEVVKVALLQRSRKAHNSNPANGAPPAKLENRRTRVAEPKQPPSHSDHT